MPQPLSRVNSKAGVFIGNAGDRPLSRHPQLAVLAIESIASWSNVESFLLRLFIQLLGGNESLGAAVYLALDGQSAKTAAIKAAAAKALEDRRSELNTLEAILALAKTSEKERNKLAHWTWGDSREIQDAVLLVDPRENLSDLDRSNVFVYKEQDFKDLINKNDRICGFGLKLKFILSGHVANQDGDLLKELSSEPEILEILAKKAKQDNQN